MSQIDFGCIFDGFTINLRFGIGEKSRGRVEQLFSPVGDRDWSVLLSNVAQRNVIQRSRT